MLVVIPESVRGHRLTVAHSWHSGAEGEPTVEEAGSDDMGRGEEPGVEHRLGQRLSGSWTAP